nr:unnamed protein product [Digitaria exilis]
MGYDQWSRGGDRGCSGCSGDGGAARVPGVVPREGEEMLSHSPWAIFGPLRHPGGSGTPAAAAICTALLNVVAAPPHYWGLTRLGVVARRRSSPATNHGALLGTLSNAALDAFLLCVD